MNYIYKSNKESYIELLKQLGSGDCINCPLFYIIKNNWRDISEWYSYECDLDVEITKCYYVALILLLFIPMFKINRSFQLSDINKFKRNDELFDIKSQNDFIDKTLMESNQTYNDFVSYFKEPHKYNTDIGIMFSVYLGVYDHGFLLERRRTGFSNRYDWIMYQAWINVKGLHIVNLSTKKISSNDTLELSNLATIIKANKKFSSISKLQIFNDTANMDYFTLLQRLLEALFNNDIHNILVSACDKNKNVAQNLIENYVKKYISIIFTITNLDNIQFKCKRKPYLKMYLYNSDINKCYHNLIKKIEEWFTDDTRFAKLRDSIKPDDSEKFKKFDEETGYSYFVTLYKIYLDMKESCPKISLDSQILKEINDIGRSIKPELKFIGADYGNK